MRAALFVTLAVSVVGCGSSGGGITADMAKNGDMAGHVADMAVGGSDAGATGDCLLANSLGALGSVVGDIDPDSLPDLLWMGALNTNTNPDYVDIELYSEFGVFTGEVTTGTFTISGDETNYATCGACILVYAQTTDTGYGAVYMATWGSITLTNVTDRLTGTLNNVTLTHVTIDDAGDEPTFETTPVGDCDTVITSMAFDAEIPAE